MNQLSGKYKIEIAFDHDEADEFVDWLKKQGHDAHVGSTSGNFVDESHTSTNEWPRQILDCLWADYCDQPEHLVISEDTKLLVAKAMIARGGGFVSALGEALMKADPENAIKIKKAFPEYWDNYSKLVRK